MMCAQLLLAQVCGVCVKDYSVLMSVYTVHRLCLQLWTEHLLQDPHGRESDKLYRVIPLIVLRLAFLCSFLFKLVLRLHSLYILNQSSGVGRVRVAPFAKLVGCNSFFFSPSISCFFFLLLWCVSLLPPSRVCSGTHAVS